MSKLNCEYHKEDKSYLLSFESNNFNFESIFKISLPDNFTYKPVTVYDGFLLAVIFKAMECGEDLNIDLPVSSQGLRNANYFIEAWNNLLPNKYKKIRVNASCIINKSKINNGENNSISAFSGGVDACFTLIRHNENDWGYGENIKNVLCVQGFDVPVDKNKEYDLLMERISPIYEQYDCLRFKVWTDLKIKSKQDWEMSFSTQLASCLHLFSEHFTQAFIGSSESYKDFILPWGSTPSTDFLLSGSNMEIIHDGAGYTRTEKVERIAKNDIAKNRLKVCWEKGFEENCGDCEKCYRTRLNFLAIGSNDPKCFDSKIDLSKIKKIKLDNVAKIAEFQSIYDYLNQRKIKPSWRSSLTIALFTGKFYHVNKRKLKNIIRK